MLKHFEETIRELTQPINGQLPRPWMTSMKNPLEADVFIVGVNQATEYPSESIPHQRHMNALFNRNGESCRALYDEARRDRPPSRTRQNIDGLSARLHLRNIQNILETDVVCYSTRVSSELSKEAHAGGTQRGRQIFRYLLSEIAPDVIIVHGSRASKDLSRVLDIPRLQVPGAPDQNCDVETEGRLVIPIPSLAPPRFYRWSTWCDDLLDNVADRVSHKLGA